MTSEQASTEIGESTQENQHRVLNLYSGLGGNRKLWENVDVVAVEKNPKIASFYADEFPEDQVIVADAHTFLEQHLRDGWDFIWASPPCQTHTRFNTVQWDPRYITPQFQTGWSG